MKDLSEHFAKLVKNDHQLQKIIELIKDNSTGRVWLVGGYVFRNLAHYLYGVELKNTDYDFIVEKSSEINLPSGWQVIKNRFGNYRLQKGDVSIDYIPLNNIDYIIKNNLQPSIENYLKGVPLDIQSIAFDLIDYKLIGEVGIKALLNKKVSINNKIQSQEYVDQLGISLEGLIKEKADSIGFNSPVSG